MNLRKENQYDKHVELGAGLFQWRAHRGMLRRSGLLRRRVLRSLQVGDAWAGALQAPVSMAQVASGWRFPDRIILILSKDGEKLALNGYRRSGHVNWLHG